MELFQLVNILIHARTQTGEPKVGLSVLLSEPIPRDGTDTRLVEQRVRIEPVRGASGLLCGLQRGGGEVQPREKVQGARGGSTGHAGERVEPRGHRHRARRQSLVDRVRLLFPERVALVPRFGGSHHAVDADLAADGHTQTDADHLVQ